MKPCSSCIITLLLAVTLGVGQGNTGEKSPQQAANVNTLPLQSPKPVPPPPPPPPPIKSEKELWPSTFIPSEKITADSVVSFPTDI